MLLAEFGCKPVSWQWCKLVCRYWNRLVQQSQYQLLREAFLTDLAYACSAGTRRRKSDAWCCDVMAMFERCVPAYADEVHGLVRAQSWHLLKPVDVDKVLDAWAAAWWHWPQVDVNPRLMPGLEPGYVAWMCQDPNVPAPYVHCDALLNPVHLMSLMRFRLGVSDLEVVRGRWRRKSKASGGRACRWCVDADRNVQPAGCVGWIEDEQHVLLECPRYVRVRQRFSQLFEAACSDMRTLLSHKQQAVVAAVVHAVLNIHKLPVNNCPSDVDSECELSSLSAVTSSEDEAEELVECML